MVPRPRAPYEESGLPAEALYDRWQYPSPGVSPRSTVGHTAPRLPTGTFDLSQAQKSGTLYTLDPGRYLLGVACRLNLVVHASHVLTPAKT